MYDYKHNVIEDCITAIKEYMKYNGIDKNEVNRTEFEDELYDVLFVDDNVTGNGSGSYTFNSKDAMNNIYGNEKLLVDALKEYGYDGLPFKRISDYEWMDVIIRCSLLSYGIHIALAEILD